MGIIKTKKNKKFNYVARYYKGDGNPYKISHKFDDARVSTRKVSGIKAKFIMAFQDLKKPNDGSARLRLLIIFVILLLIALYLIDFDASFFVANANM